MTIDAHLHTSCIPKLQRIDFTSFLNLSIIYPTFIWILQLSIAILTKLIFTLVLTPGPHPGSGFHSWDGNFYIGIAKNGYDHFLKVAFFPVYPLTIRLLSTFTHLSLAHSGFLISNFSFLIALIFFYKTVLKKFGQLTAQRALWLLITFPFSLYFNVVYTESLTLLTLVLFFYFLEQDKWYPAILVGSCAAILHDLNFLVGFISLIYLLRIRKFLNRKEIILRFLSLTILPYGVFIYLAFIYHKYHVLFPFAKIQAEGWDRIPIIPYTNIITIFKEFIINKSHLTQTFNPTYIFITMINGVAVIGISILTIYMILQYRDNKLITFELKFFTLITLLLSISTAMFHGTSLETYGRGMVILFPTFIVWANRIHKDTVFLTTLMLMLPFKIILLGMFVSGY